MKRTVGIPVLQTFDCRKSFENTIRTKQKHTHNLVISIYKSFLTILTDCNYVHGVIIKY